MGAVTHGKLSEFSKIENALINADITTDRESTFRSAAGYKAFRAHLQTNNNVDNTKLATVQLLQAKDASGTDKKALSAVTTYTSAADNSIADISAEATIDELDADNGYTYIAVKVTSDNGTAVIGSAVLELGDPDYLPAT